MKTILGMAVLVAACFSSGGFGADGKCMPSADVIPLCTVLSNAANYDGKEVTVEGLYRMVIHGSILMSPACAKTYVNTRRSPDYKAAKHATTVIRSITKKDQFGSVDVVYRGTFRSAHLGQCFGQNCLPFEIEIHELICARAPKPMELCPR